MSTRTYPRRFDWDDARIGFANGETPKALANEYGVSETAVRRVVIPGEQEKDNLRKAQWQSSGVCADCGTSCTHPNHPSQGAFGVPLCEPCSGRRRRTRFVATEWGLMARCFSCGEIKTLDNYPGGTRYKDVRPKGVHGCCRACQTEIKRRWRLKNAEKEREYELARAERRRATA